MIKNKFFAIAFSIIILNSHSAFSSINNEVIVKVGNQIISTYELKNKIKTKLFLTNQEISQENINKLKSQILNSLIQLKLMKIELEKFKIKVLHDKQTNSYLEEIAKRYDTNIKGLKLIFESNNLDFEDFKHEIDTHQAWKNLVYRTHKSKILIDQEEIEIEMNNLIKEQKKLEEYNLAEIEIQVKDSSETEVAINILQMKIKEIGFEDTAVKFSSSTTALNNGSLGWVNKEILSKNIQDALSGLKMGEVTKPIVNGNSILLIKLIDKRSVNMENIDTTQLRKNITIAKQNELLNIFSNNYLSKLRNNTFINIK